MSKLNKATLKQKVADFINRVAPFTDPLIQKTEDLEIRDDYADSQIFAIPTETAINNPAAAFNADFASAEVINIDTTSSIPSDFVITLQNLDGNVSGKLNITKKTSQTFSFGNAVILIIGGTDGQIGLSSIQFEIIAIGSTYFANPLYSSSSGGGGFIGNGGNTAGNTSIIQKVMDLGNWDMSFSSFDVNHGLDASKIRSIVTIVRTDAAVSPTRYWQCEQGILDGDSGNEEMAVSHQITATQIKYTRRAIADFTDWDQSGYNRGTIIITYEA